MLLLLNGGAGGDTRFIGLGVWVLGDTHYQKGKSIDIIVALAFQLDSKHLAPNKAPK